MGKHVYRCGYHPRRKNLSDEIKQGSRDNCEYEGVLGTLAGIVGCIQANEVVKEILNIGNSLCGHILIIDALKLTFRKVKLNKRSDCYCNEKKK